MTDEKPTPKPGQPKKFTKPRPEKAAVSLVLTGGGGGGNVLSTSTTAVPAKTGEVASLTPHPQPGIFETTSVTVNGKSYGFEDYLDGRHLVFGDLDEMNEIVHLNMLANGWDHVDFATVGEGSTLTGTVLVPGPF